MEQAGSEADGDIDGDILDRQHDSARCIAVEEEEKSSRMKKKKEKPENPLL